MHQPISKPDREHFFWIDALRGMAAIIVLISHVSIFGLYGYEHVLASWPPTRLLWAGHQAVTLFFVISGFALYLLAGQIATPLARWPTFIAVRFLRLYPPYIASLVLALAAVKAPALLGMSLPPGAPVIANGELTSGTLIGHVLMIGIFDVSALNPPIWTLVYEARLSLLFPLIYLAVAHGGRRTFAGVILIWIASVGYSAGYDLGIWPENRLARSIAATANFATIFCVGALVARFRARIATWVSRQRPRKLLALLAASIAVFMFGYGYCWPETVPTTIRVIADLVVAVMSAWFVALAIATPAPARPALPQFFGTISYSLYLVHQPVVIGTIALFYGRCSAPVLWLISIAGAIGVAWLFYLAVEWPSKAAARALRRGPAVAAPAPAA